MSFNKNHNFNYALYRIVWRWHFLAGVMVLPFVLILAVTGGIYIFKDEINDTVYHHLRFVEPAGTPPLAPTRIVAAALDARPGKVKAYTPSPVPDRSAEVDILGTDDRVDTVYVDPYRGDVLGHHRDGGAAGSPAMLVVRKLHSLEYVGWFGNRMMEAAVGWIVLLVATGIYLWWPRGRNLGTFSVKAILGRPWFRDLHAVTGIYAGLIIVFLAMTGLPWSAVWGGKFYDYAYALGLGIPDGYWSNTPTSTRPVSSVLDQAPWIMEKQPMPLSAVHQDAPRPLDAVVARVEALGIVAGYSVTMPDGPDGVFTASVYPDDISFERVIHLDQYTGEVLYDAGLAGLGALGLWSEWGISVHMGQQWGWVNQFLLFLTCGAMILLSVTGAAMWWKRRPKGALGVPEMPADWRMPRGLLLMAIAAGIFFPLVGLSMLAIAPFEIAALLRNRRRLRVARFSG